MISCSGVDPGAARAAEGDTAVVRRCRPLLGTFVEIATRGGDASAVLDRAFDVIRRIQDSMSVHDPSSELSRLNREAGRRTITVSGGLYDVLQRGWLAAERSAGAFDYTVAPRLASWGLRPAWLRRRHAGDWRSVELLSGRRVRFTRPVAIDLGGIAKGHAVDRAVETLREMGVESGLVNAGGDLRTFGGPAWRIHLRHPASGAALGGHSSGGELSPVMDLRDAAIATSAPGPSMARHRGRQVSHLVHPPSGSAVTAVCSVTVRAAECWLADVLAKVVLNAPDLAGDILAERHAQALVLTA